MPSSCQFVLLCMSMEYTTYSAGCKELVISWATMTADFSHALQRSERLHSVSAFSYMTRTVHRWICSNERQFKYACKWTTNRIKENYYWQERNWFGITFSLVSLTSKQLQNECQCHHRKAFSPIKARFLFSHDARLSSANFRSATCSRWQQPISDLFESCMSIIIHCSFPKFRKEAKTSRDRERKKNSKGR